MPDADIFSKSLLERAGLEQRQFRRSEQAEPGESVRYDITKDEPGQLRFRNHPLSDLTARWPALSSARINRVGCARMAKKKKIRADFRKNRTVRARASDWTQTVSASTASQDEAPPQSERISGKGDLARRRTVCGDQLDGDDRAGLRRPSRRGRERLPSRPGAQRARADQHGRGRQPATSISAPPGGC